MARKDGYKDTDLNKGWSKAGQANVKESRTNGDRGKPGKRASKKK